MSFRERAFTIVLLWMGLLQASLSFSPSTTRLFRTQRTIRFLSDDDFMKDLKTRMDQVSDRDTKLPIVVFDSMLPNQVLKIEIQDQVFMELIRTLVEKENPCFGMVGTFRVSGQQVPLQNGVEVSIVGQPKVVESEAALRVELRAGRRMRMVEDELITAPQGWTEARVRFLDAEQERQDEEDGEDPLALARAMSKARELTSPNMNMPDNASLVDRWIQLAREKERSPGQIDQLLQDLGEIPSSDEPTERALWVGALINPLPAMGVAIEVRPQLLMAKTAEARMELALFGIQSSIKHMDGSAPMW